MNKKKIQNCHYVKYYCNNKLHRTNGPAIEWSDGDRWYYLNGNRYTEEEFNKIILFKKLELM